MKKCFFNNEKYCRLFCSRSIESISSFLWKVLIRPNINDALPLPCNFLFMLLMTPRNEVWNLQKDLSHLTIYISQSRKIISFSVYFFSNSTNRFNTWLQLNHLALLYISKLENWLLTLFNRLVNWRLLNVWAAIKGHWHTVWPWDTNWNCPDLWGYMQITCRYM